MRERDIQQVGKNAVVVVHANTVGHVQQKSRFEDLIWTNMLEAFFQKSFEDLGLFS